MRANGYGADLEFDGDHVTIYPGKVMARMSGATSVTIPVAAMTRVDYRAANFAVNGVLHFHVHDPSPQTLQDYAGRGPIPPEGTQAHKDYVKQGVVTTQTLVVHWRKKDQAAFEALYLAIHAAVGATT